MRKTDQEKAELTEIRGDGNVLICCLGWCNDKIKIITKNGGIDWDVFYEKVNKALQAHKGRRGKKKKLA